MHADGSRGSCGQGGTQNNTKNMYKWERRAIFCSARQLQNNKANFGRTKKSNRENNKHKFGRVRLAKVLHENISKAQVHTVVKKYPKKHKTSEHKFMQQADFTIKKSKHKPEQ